MSGEQGGLQLGSCKKCDKSGIEWLPNPSKWQSAGQNILPSRYNYTNHNFPIGLAKGDKAMPNLS
jgi:hypothetical protein